MKNILLTGGTGYIGSHTAVELINNNFNPIIVDNLSNSSIEMLDKIKQITGKKPKFYQLNVEDPEIEQVFTDQIIDGVIHFAGLKAVGESVEQPLKYYKNNLESTINLIEIMNSYNVNKFVFSSSATVYGTNMPPYSEDMPTGQGITNPYGQTKFMIEQILKDFTISKPEFKAICLRYFNPIGTHKSGLIGENPSGIPNNLLPYVLKVAAGDLKEVKIFGNDYQTPDGTGIRDYIHVVDLAEGHVKALQKISDGWQAINLGTGEGSSVLEIIEAVKKSSGKDIPCNFVERRKGDLAISIAKTDKANSILNWKAKRNINQACQDSWNWIKNERKI